MKYVVSMMIVGWATCLYGEGRLEVVKKIPFDTTGCMDITPNPSSKVMYVANGRKVWVVNTENDEIIKKLEVDTSVRQIVLNENTSPPTLIVVEDTICIYNAQTYELVRSWGVTPWRVAVGKERLYLMFSGTQTNEYIVRMYTIDYSSFIDSFKVKIDGAIFKDIKVNKQTENIYIVFESLTPEKNIGIVVDKNEKVLDTLRFGECYSSQIWINDLRSTIWVSNFWYNGCVWKVKEEDFSISRIPVALGMTEFGPADIEGLDEIGKVYGACMSGTKSIVVIDEKSEQVIEELGVGPVWRIGVMEMGNSLNKIYAASNDTLYVIEEKVGVEEERKIEGFRVTIVNNLENLIIRYEIPTPSMVEFGVYDVSGRNIKILEKEEKTEGLYQLEWDLSDKGSKKVRKGVYFIRGKIGNNRVREKVILF